MSIHRHNDTSVRFINHACCIIEHGDTRVLCDPWLDGTIFNDSWRLIVDTDIDAIPRRGISMIWISHEHPDHLHFPSLKRLWNHFEDKPIVGMVSRENDNVQKAIEKIGYKFVSLRQDRVAELGSMQLSVLAHGDDSLLLVSTPDATVVNQNDCKIPLGEADNIAHHFGPIGIWLCQFSLAGWHANEGDARGLSIARGDHAQNYIHYMNTWRRPAVCIPFASYVEFCRQANAYMNQWRVLPSDLPGVEIPLPEGVDDAAPAFWWRQRFEKRVAIVPEPKHDHQLTNLDCAGLPDVSLVTESSSFSIINGRGEWGRKADSPDAFLPESDLRFAFACPWGADTANIAGTAKIFTPRFKQFLVALDARYHRGTGQ